MDLPPTGHCEIGSGKGGDLRFVTFEVKTLIGPVQRVGVLRGRKVIDLHAAYSSYLREVRGIHRWRELAHAIMPGDMLKFIEGGEMSMEAARVALDYLERIRGSAEGHDGGEAPLSAV
jgi:hypothetical protein